MKRYITIITILAAFIFTSCSSVRVASDYDSQANFQQYRTFAFFKPGIDKADISDLDKKRILRAIESDLIAKGFVKSDNPDMLVSIFTKTQKNVNVNNNNFGWGFGWGWGWNPWIWGNYGNNVSQVTEGTLYIDFIDARRKELIWQGMGTSALTTRVDKKQEKMNEIVFAILEKYPPEERRGRRTL